MLFNRWVLWYSIGPVGTHGRPWLYPLTAERHYVTSVFGVGQLTRCFIPWCKLLIPSITTRNVSGGQAAVQPIYDLMALDHLMDLLAHRCYVCFTSISFNFSYFYVRQTTLASSRSTFRRKKTIDWLIPVVSQKWWAVQFYCIIIAVLFLVDNFQASTQFFH